jgi:hypothetical protein
VGQQALRELDDALDGYPMLTEFLTFLDELLSYLESVRDVRGEEGRPGRRSPALERLTQKTRALRDAVSAESQKTLMRSGSLGPKSN